MRTENVEEGRREGIRKVGAGNWLGRNQFWKKYKFLLSKKLVDKITPGEKNTHVFTQQRTTRLKIDTQLNGHTPEKQHNSTATRRRNNTIERKPTI